MDKIYVGKIVTTHGIKGEVRILSDFQFPEKIFKVGCELIIDDQKYIIMSCMLPIISSSGYLFCALILSFQHWAARLRISQNVPCPCVRRAHGPTDRPWSATVRAYSHLDLSLHCGRSRWHQASTADI